MDCKEDDMLAKECFPPTSASLEMIRLYGQVLFFSYNMPIFTLFRSIIFQKLAMISW